MADGIKCDVCGGFADRSETEGWMSIERFQAPSNTLMFFTFGSGSVSRPLHVCSWTCLSLLAIRAPDLEEATET